MSARATLPDDASVTFSVAALRALVADAVAEGVARALATSAPQPGLSRDALLRLRDIARHIGVVEVSTIRARCLACGVPLRDGHGRVLSRTDAELLDARLVRVRMDDWERASRATAPLPYLPTPPRPTEHRARSTRRAARGVPMP